MTSDNQVCVFFSSQPINGYIQWYLDRAKKESSACTYFIDRAHVSIDAFIEQVSMSFLGQSKTIIIRDTDTSVHDTKLFDTYIKSYTGPHKVVLFTQRSLYQKQAQIISEFASKQDFLKLAQTMEITLAPSFVNELFAGSQQQYSWEQACMLMHYAVLIGQRSQQFFRTWFTRICRQDQSLFTLSGYFFSRDTHAFTRAWHDIKPLYGNEFWIVFWAEQLWQALMYIESVGQGNTIQGRKKSYRLPFSFFQKDYKKHTRESLTLVHEKLYRLDYDYKNGRDMTYALDFLLIV